MRKYTFIEPNFFIILIIILFFITISIVNGQVTLNTEQVAEVGTSLYKTINGRKIIYNIEVIDGYKILMIDVSYGNYYQFINLGKIDEEITAESY